MKFRTNLMAAVALTALMAPAFAADLPVKARPIAEPVAVANWTGLYLEGYGAWYANMTDVTVTAGSTVADLASAPNGPGFGGGIGYLYDFGNFVGGLRGEIGYANIRGSGQINSAALNVSNATNYKGDLDVIVGIPFTADRRLLGYLDGGFAFGGAKPNLNFATVSAAASDTSTGWNIGGGLAYMIAPNFVVGIEGDYYRLGDKSLTGTDPLTGAAIITSTNRYEIVEQRLFGRIKF